MSPSHENHAARFFSLHTFGGLSLVAPSGEVVRQQRRRLALLVLVAAAGDRGLSRDKLIAWLSPESTTDSARHSLNQLLYYLRQQAGEDVFIGSDPLRLNPEIVGSDLVEFEAAIRSGEREKAVALYKGPFLEGFHLSDSPEFDEWASGERSRLAAMFADTLLELAGDATRRGDHRQSTRWWRQLASIDPLSGSAARGLVQSLAASGDVPAALIYARGHEALVRSELGTDPDPEFARVVERLQAGPDVVSIAKPIAGPDVKPAAAEPLSIARAAEVGHTRRQPKVWITAGLFAAAAGGYLLLFSGNTARPAGGASSGLSRGDQILVGDFDAPSPDSLSARALSEALRGSLGDSRAFAIVSRAEVDRALERMQRPIRARLDGLLVQELAARNGYEAVLNGAITPIGTGYVLSARLTTAAGKEIVTLSENAASADALIAAVGRLSNALLRAIGESASAVDSVKPLEQVTTSSLRALELYTQAADETREGRGNSTYTLGLLRQAIAHDSAFAMAHRFLGIKLYLVDSTKEALRELKLAQKFSSRLTEIERLSALSTLHFLLRDYPQSADEAGGVLRLDPENRWAINQLGILYNFLGRYEDGKDIARRRSRLDSTGRSHLLALELYAGRNAEAFAAARRFFNRYKSSSGSPSSAEARRVMAIVHFATGGFDSTEFYAEPRGSSDPGDVLLLGSSQLARGQVRKAFLTMRPGPRSADDRGSVPHFSALTEAEAAMATVLMAGDRRSAARRLDAVLTDREYHRGEPANRRVSPILALSLAGRVADARRELAAIHRSADEDVLVARQPELSLARGSIALAENRLAESIEAFRAASSSFSMGYDACRVCALPWLGRAYEAAGQIDSAVAVYERYLSTGDVDRMYVDGLWRAVTLRQLGNLYAERGDTARAIRRLGEFAALWNGADSELQAQVAAARMRIAALRQPRMSRIRPE